MMSMLLCGTTALFAGCQFEEDLPATFEEGDFYFSVYDNLNHVIRFKLSELPEDISVLPEADNYTIRLNGLTDIGKTKDVVVVPSYIRGMKVSALSIDGMFVAVVGEVKSECLKTIYFSSAVTVGSEVTFDAPNLSKVVIIDNKLGTFKATGRPKREINNNDWFLEKGDLKIYVPSTHYKGNESSYVKAANSHAEYHCANVSYFYNFEGAEKDGYYWVDNFDYGTKIDYIPVNPEREGYVFGGWYKEAEGVTKWDFDVDKLPEAELNQDGEEIYRETQLYAKWYKN